MGAFVQFLAMMSMYRFLVLLLLNSQADGASGPGYPVCLSGCLQTAAGPACVWATAGGAITGPVGWGLTALWCASVFSGCAAGCVCFDPSTSIMTSDGFKPIADVREGDKVWGRGNYGDDALEDVLGVTYVPGNFSFVSIRFTDESSLS